MNHFIYGVALIGELWETLIEQIKRDDVSPPPPQKKESNESI
jgi:hypothetical protein